MRITEQDKATLIELWNNRLSPEKIGKLLPYKVGTIRRTTRELLEDGTLNRANRIQSKRDRIANMYLSGVTDIGELAEMFEVEISYVIQGLKHNNIEHQRNTVYKKRKPNARIDERTQAIIDELKNGKKQSKIAKQFGVSPQWVFSIKKRFLKEQ